MQRLVSAAIQRHHTDNADDFMAWVLASEAWKEWSPQGVEGKCDPAARAFAAVLTAAHIPFIVRHLVFVAPAKGNLNRNHFVVIATVAKQQIVIDATQGQFQGGAAMVAPLGTWQTQFEATLLRIAVGGTSKAPIFEHQQWPSFVFDAEDVDASIDMAGGKAAWPTLQYAEAKGARGGSKGCVIL